MLQFISIPKGQLGDQSSNRTPDKNFLFKNCNGFLTKTVYKLILSPQKKICYAIMFFKLELLSICLLKPRDALWT